MTIWDIQSRHDTQVMENKSNKREKCLKNNTRVKFSPTKKGAHPPLWHQFLFRIFVCLSGSGYFLQPSGQNLADGLYVRLAQ